MHVTDREWDVLRCRYPDRGGLIDEYVACYNAARQPLTVPDNTTHVVMLTGTYCGPKTGPREHADTEENADRIRAAVRMVLEAASCLPTLVIDGETEEEIESRGIAVSAGMPADAITYLDCGPTGSANTGTQLQVLADYLRYETIGHVVLVTTDYHVPRVFRTARHWIGGLTSVTREVVGIPSLMGYGYNVRLSKVLEGEIERVKRYSASGIISPIP
jgi:hypothetical protein